LIPALLIYIIFFEAFFPTSLGKRIFGFTVQNKHGSRASFSRRMARAGIKYSFATIFCSGVMFDLLFIGMRSFGVVCGFFVGLIVLITIALLLMNGLEREGQAYFDRWLGLRVVRRRANPSRGFPIDVIPDAGIADRK
jgi:uncharacterized RDD family membrane protein YckC